MVNNRPNKPIKKCRLMDITPSESHRREFEQSIEAIKAKYPDIWEQAKLLSSKERYG